MPEFNLFGERKRPEICTEYGCGELLAEFAEENPTFDNYIPNGVKLDTEGGKLRLSYNGLLAKSGAQDVYAVVNYGSNKYWDDVKYYPMNNVGRNTFEALLPINGDTSINVAFKDGANNWDNNSGKNYSFNVH